jgi:hypothetical protein
VPRSPLSSGVVNTRETKIVTLFSCILGGRELEVLSERGVLYDLSLSRKERDGSLYHTLFDLVIEGGGDEYQTEPEFGACFATKVEDL